MLRSPGHTGRCGLIVCFMQRLFLSDAGDPVSAITADEAADLLARAAAIGAPPEAEMIETAARSAFPVAWRLIGDRQTDEGHVLVAAGPGYTGAVGLAVARHLHNHGRDVEVLLPIPPTREVATRQLGTCSNAGVPIKTLSDPVREFPSLCIDALTGVLRSGQYIEAIERSIPILIACRSAARDTPRGTQPSGGSTILSLETPSGIDPTTGVAADAYVVADATICFGFPRTGMGSPECGELFVADIGIPPRVYRREATIAHPCHFGGEFTVRLLRNP